MFFLEQYQHVIDKVKDNATKATLQKAHTLLVAIDAIQPINDMIDEWYSSRHTPTTQSYRQLEIEIEAY